MSYCDWDTTDELCLRYHDEEWGVPLHDDRGQFEFLSLEVMQCGLNWTMMLHKREVFRACFAGFDYDAVAAFGPDDVERILETPGMIRSRRKVEAIVGNARCFQHVRAEFGSFDAYLWGFSDGKTILCRRVDSREQRPFGARGGRPAKARLQVPGPHDGLLAPPSLRHHQRPRSRLPALRGGQRPGPHSREAPPPREGRPPLRIGGTGMTKLPYLASAASLWNYE